MNVQLTDLIADIRVMSGLRNNTAISDSQIISFANDGHSELQDRFVASLQHWFRKSVRFSLSGNTAGSNTYDLTQIPDFQMDQGVNYYPSGYGQRGVTVPRMSSFTERNNIGGFGNLGRGREYFTNGDTLYINPFANSQGAYELIYTPQATSFALSRAVQAELLDVSIPCDGSVTGFSPGAFNAVDNPFLSSDVGNNFVCSGTVSNNRSFEISAFVSAGSVDTTPAGTSEAFPTSAHVTLLRASRVDGAGTWVLYGDTQFANGFSRADVGGTIAVKGSQHNDGVFPLTAVTDPSTIVTSGTTTPENFGAGVAITFQPANTISELPAIMTPWALFLKVHASIAIKTARNQPITELQAKLQLQLQRITAMAKLRSEGVQQAPTTRRRGRCFGGYR